MHMRTSFNSIDHPQWFQHLNVNVIFMLNYIKLNYVENYFHIYIYMYIYIHMGIYIYIYI